MDIYSIKIQNSIVLNRDLEDIDIKNFIEHWKDRMVYPVSIFFNFPIFNYSFDDIEEKFLYFYKNINNFLLLEEENYTDEDSRILATYLILKNINFNFNNYKESLAFIESKENNYSPTKELIKWALEEIELIKISLYAYELENYKNGTIDKLLKKNENIINNHKEGLIFNTK